MQIFFSSLNVPTGRQAGHIHAPLKKKKRRALREGVKAKPHSYLRCKTEGKKRKKRTRKALQTRCEQIQASCAKAKTISGKWAVMRGGGSTCLIIVYICLSLPLCVRLGDSSMLYAGIACLPAAFSFCLLVCVRVCVLLSSNSQLFFPPFSSSTISFSFAVSLPACSLGVVVFLPSFFSLVLLAHSYSVDEHPIRVQTHTQREACSTISLLFMSTGYAPPPPLSEACDGVFSSLSFVPSCFLARSPHMCLLAPPAFLFPSEFDSCERVCMCVCVSVCTGMCVLFF